MSRNEAKMTVRLSGEFADAAQERRSQEQKSVVNRPDFWAHRVEDRINGILQQVQQHFGKSHSLRLLLERHSDELSDYIGNQQWKEDES